MSLFAVVFEGSSPMGGLVAGAISATFGGRAAFVAAGAAALVLAVLSAPILTRSAPGGLPPREA